jgi:hypothetical protein
MMLASLNLGIAEEGAPNGEKSALGLRKSPDEPAGRAGRRAELPVTGAGRRLCDQPVPPGVSLDLS